MASESSKTVRTFAAEVKAADYDTEIPELSQVIPAEYLDIYANYRLH